MENIWFILIAGKKEGPYSFVQLRNHKEITPDTLVWREGFAKWIPIREVSELAKVFQDEIPISEKDELKIAPSMRVTPDEQLAIEMRPSLPNFFFWALIISLLLFYLFNQFQNIR